MHDVLKLILDASLVAKLILIILVFLSLVSWALIFDKFRILRRVQRESRQFLQLLQSEKTWEALYERARVFRYSPQAGVFKAAYQEGYHRNNRPEKGEAVFNPVAPAAVLTRPPKPLMVEALHDAAGREMAELEQSLVILATTASASPFLGLFGTVWGVMSAFMSIGTRGSAELSVVGPGIAEALITTVAGLAAAIPALIAYNYFVDRLRRIDGELSRFTGDLVRVIMQEKPR
ncbi:MAG: MotA/TolQ/ExbB proton channel family protein [Calditrichaeota bacterium]|nr:MotA/TolQ/ExbB proton channel family protein [Calditrichota bacterium]MCB0313025.1 MotA/TolQ/ExbB proton channel family protein [Calditrichota bacterium]MCB9087872.1 MotA/TolQ/ExbB proton channel family protein [Calditrichia bacterium]